MLCSVRKLAVKIVSILKATFLLKTLFSFLLKTVEGFAFAKLSFAKGLLVFFLSPQKKSCASKYLFLRTEQSMVARSATIVALRATMVSLCLTSPKAMLAGASETPSGKHGEFKEENSNCTSYEAQQLSKEAQQLLLSSPFLHNFRLCMRCQKKDTRFERFFYHSK